MSQDLIKLETGRKADELTKKEEAFIAHYIANGFNGKKAAELAGYKNPGATATQLLKRKKVREEVDKSLESVHLDAKHLLARLSEIVNCSIADFCDDNGQVIWARVKEKGYLIKSRKLRVKRVKIGDDAEAEIEQCEIELHDPLSAIDKILKVLGAYKEAAPQIQVNTTGPTQFVVGLKRKRVTLNNDKKWLMEALYPSAYNGAIWPNAWFLRKPLSANGIRAYSEVEPSKFENGKIWPLCGYTIGWQEADGCR